MSRPAFPDRGDPHVNGNGPEPAGLAYRRTALQSHTGGEMKIPAYVRDDVLLLLVRAAQRGRTVEYGPIMRACGIPRGQAVDPSASTMDTPGNRRGLNSGIIEIHPLNGGWVRPSFRGFGPITNRLLLYEACYAETIPAVRW